VQPVRRRVDALDVRVHPTTESMAAEAAADAAHAVGSALHDRGAANVMFATGNSQLAFLDALARESVDWSGVVAFHMDEYVGLDASHAASFARYIREHVEDRLHPGVVHYLHGDATDPDGEAARYAALLADHPLDLAVAGIGENGHLAFNDPPVADFDDPLAVKVVELDERSRRQQVGEGHFASLEDVPRLAITVTISTVLAARRVIVVVPESRKAEAVHAALSGPVTTACPASVLRRSAHAVLYLDADAAARVSLS
jgi:glucosamine-6-phosphate deaminase